MTGMVCEKHGAPQWCPDGVCRWCDGAQAPEPTATSCACGDTIVGGIRFPDGFTTNDGRVHAAGGCTSGPTHLLTSTEERANVAPVTGLLERLTRSNPLLVDKPYGAQPVVRCACGEFTYDPSNQFPPISPWPYHSISGIHTPERCSGPDWSQNRGEPRVDAADRITKAYEAPLPTQEELLRARYMGLPTVPNPLLVELPYGESPAVTARRDAIGPWTTCACGAQPLTGAEIRSGGVYHVGYQTHAYDRCVTEREC